MYLIQGKVGIQNSDSDTQGGSCQLNIAGSMADLDRVQLPPAPLPLTTLAETFLPLSATADLTQGGGMVTITCATFNGVATERR